MSENKKTHVLYEVVIKCADLRGATRLADALETVMDEGVEVREAVA